MKKDCFSSFFLLRICESGKKLFLDNLMIDKMLRGNRSVSARTGRNYNFLYDCLTVVLFHGQYTVLLEWDLYEPIKNFSVQFWTKRSTQKQNQTASCIWALLVRTNIIKGKKQDFPNFVLNLMASLLYPRGNRVSNFHSLLYIWK